MVKKNECFPFKMGNKTKTSILITIIDVLSSAQAWRGKKKDIQIGKEEVKWSVCR